MTAKRARQVKLAKAFARQHGYTFKRVMVEPQMDWLTWSIKHNPLEWWDRVAVIYPDDHQIPSAFTITAYPTPDNPVITGKFNAE